MNYEEPAGVRMAATRFRLALERGGLSLATLTDFPSGACGDASEMLGQYFSDCGLGSWIYRSCQSLPSHAWIERDRWIVDITADQFHDVTESIIVTRDRGWHDSRFPSSPGRRAASMDWFATSLVQAEAHADYELLRERADRSQDSITAV